jgi:hypothetical protein
MVGWLVVAIVLSGGGLWIAYDKMDLLYRVEP